MNRSFYGYFEKKIKMTSSIKTKTDFSVTDIRGAKMSLIKVGERPGFIMRISSDGVDIGIDMTEKSLHKLQHYLNIRFPAKTKHKRKRKINKATSRLKRAIKDIKICKAKIEAFNEICNCVCDEMVLFPECVMNGRKKRALSAARSVITYVVRAKTNLSYPDMAEMFGEKTHTSSLLRIKNYKDTNKYRDRTFGEIVLAVSQKIGKYD